MQGVSSIALAADEMAAVASLNNRATNKLLHMSLSAALEDGRLPEEQWLHAVARMEATLGLGNLLRVTVRHCDKTHDHVHAFWCLISPETGQTPPKRWFLKKGCAVQGIGPHALSDAELTSVPATNRARRTYDFRALHRCQDACRQLERELKLRRLKSPQEASLLRVARETTTMAPTQRKRAERVGSTPLINRADDIRAALDTPDWPSKVRALTALGLEFEPTFRPTKNGTELRGLVIYDAADPGNRMKASQLDTPSRKYGFRRLEERHDARALSLEAWWPKRESDTPASSPKRGSMSRLKEDYSMLLERHRFIEREKSKRRKALRQKQARERARKQKELMERRRGEASLMPAAHRRAFYKLFSSSVRMPELSALARAHQDQAADLARKRVPCWSEHLAMCATRGDYEAASILKTLQPRPVQVSRSKSRTLQQGVQITQSVADLGGEARRELRPIQHDQVPDIQQSSQLQLSETPRRQQLDRSPEVRSNRAAAALEGDTPHKPKSGQRDEVSPEALLSAYRALQARGR